MNKKNHSTWFRSGRFAAVVLLAGCLLTGLLPGEGAALSPEGDSAPPASTFTTDQKTILLEKQIAKAPRSLPLRNRLAWSYIQKGRETGDVAYFTRAERLLEKTLAQAGTNGEALGLRAWVALFKHEFKEAAVWGEKARAVRPKVSFHYGILSDAYLETGDYPKAIEAAQTMLDLNPDQGSFSRAAHLRSLHGDPEGAIELWQKAVHAGAPAAENTAWCQVELGDEHFNIGRFKDAETAYQEALKTFPGYHRAAAGLARLRAGKGRAAEAITLYHQAIESIPYPHYIASLGDLYSKMGKPEEAKKQYALVEQIATLDQVNQVLYNRDLALFYADHDRNLGEALRLIEREAAVRKDIYTDDVLGWVYYKSQRYQEAERAAKRALRLGTKDPRLLYHAGMIARAVGKEKEAKRLLNQALALNPHFHPVYEQNARQTLVALENGKGGPS